ncbi:MAG: hypothetical protein RL215_295 [Planctomycetota bacterium]
MFSEHEGDFHGLFVVESGIDGAAVVAREVGFGEISRTSGAFRDVFSGEFEVDTGELCADLAVDAEGADDFGDDIIEGAGFDAIAGGLSISVHGITAPEDSEVGPFDGFCEAWELGGDFIGAEAVDESESSGFVGGVENADDFEEFVGGDGVTDFESDGVANSAAVFDVCAIECAGAIADPEHVCAEVIEAAGAFGASEGLFVVQEERFVGRKEIDSSELREFAWGDDFHEADGVAE